MGSLDNHDKTVYHIFWFLWKNRGRDRQVTSSNSLIAGVEVRNGEVIFSLDWELVYEPGEGIEVHLRHGRSLSRPGQEGKYH